MTPEPAPMRSRPLRAAWARWLRCGGAGSGPVTATPSRCASAPPPPWPRGARGRASRRARARCGRAARAAPAGRRRGAEPATVNGCVHPPTARRRNGLDLEVARRVGGLQGRRAAVPPASRRPLPTTHTPTLAAGLLAGDSADSSRPRRRLQAAPIMLSGRITERAPACTRTAAAATRCPRQRGGSVPWRTRARRSQRRRSAAGGTPA